VLNSGLDYLFVLMTILLSLVSIFATLLTYGSIRDKVRHSIVVDFVAFLTTIDIFLWNLLPAFLRIFSGGQWESDQGISSFEMIQVYTLEFVSLLLFYLSFFVVFRIRKLNSCYFGIASVKRIIHSNKSHILHTYSQFLSPIIKRYDLFFILIILSGLYITIGSRFFGIENPTIIPGLGWLLKPVIGSSFSIFLVHYVFLSNLYMRITTKIVSLVALLFLLILGITDGSHGNIFGPFIYIVFYNIFHNIHRPLLYIGILSMVFLLLFRHEMHEFRTFKEGIGVSVSTFEALKLITTSGGRPSVSETRTSRSLLDEVEWRFGENSRKSAGFIRMYNDGESPGYAPFLNSLYVLPRQFYDQKPVPGSVNGDALTIGSRLIHAKIAGTKWNMSGFFTGLHSFWEYGFTGLIVHSIVIGVYSAIVLIFCGNLFYLGLPLIIVLHDTWWAMPKLWSSEVVIQFSRILIPLLIVWYVFKYLHIIFTKIKRYI
jgi:hypothetical protein